MSKGGGEDVATSTSTAAPPEFILDALQNAVGRAQKLSKDPREFFPDSTVVPFGEDTLAGIDELRGQVGRESEFLGLGNEVFRDILGGGADAGSLARGAASAIGDFVPGSNATFGLSGRAGSGLAGDALGRGITRAVGDEQSNVRNRQLTALGLLPGMEGLNLEQDFFDANLLGQIGGIEEGKEGEFLAEDISRFNFEQNEPRQRLAEFIAMLQGTAPLAGGTTTGETVTPNQGGGFGEILGALAPLAFSAIFPPAAAAGAGAASNLLFA